VADGEPDEIGKGEFFGVFGGVGGGASLSGSAFQLTLHLIFGL